MTPCSDSKRFRKQIGQEIPRTYITIDVFSQPSKWQKVISGKVVYVVCCICQRGLKHAVAETTNSSKTSCRRRRNSPNPAVVYELDDYMHYIDSVSNDVVNPQ